MEYASKGIAGTGLGLGIAGTALGLMGNALPNLFNTTGNGCGCSDNTTVNRYDLNMSKELAAKDSEIALLKADAYTNQKFADLNDRYNDRFTNIEAQLARQAVHNQKTEDSFALAQADLCAVKSELKHDIALEAERRCCSDNALADYVNQTFYPKMVADVTAGTTTTAQTTYNPVRNCGCCK